MRAVIQRVKKASVTEINLVNNEVVSSIGKGICVLLGISRDDTDKDLEYIVRKILNVRLFEGGEGKKWECGVKDAALEILCVSQFTLYGVLKGNKMDFRQSMVAEQSEAVYRKCLQQLADNYKPEAIKEGRFGAMMDVELVNDGPVTVNLDSRNRD